ncbi:uncharacterized protein DSM5745_05042 [Aspergillus mulundensis]|uniref:Uncharacterized protein n=1 Tax=Aspergillus mulundensis TaxID=1810919 RepID=A0A3D8S5A2_9EURO|nr:hypothetical protein DSM5745_05042 [Aspergillus mulundensis]RDW81485.1 hypothetical protein DSM5745_05042 [Aspergillus mulundensis]
MASLFLIASLCLVSRSLASIAGNNISTAINSDDFSGCLTYDHDMVSSNTLSLAASDLNSGSAPFTWTMGIRLDTDPAPDDDSDSNTDNMILLARDFYFGYAPAASSSASISSCNIIFLDISGTAVLYPNLSTTAVDWTQELPDDCARGIKMQIDTAARQAYRSGQDAATFCETWRFDYNDELLGICLNAGLGGNVMKAITINASSPENCTAASGLDYNVRPVYSRELKYQRDRIESKPMIQGTTPIVTVLFPPADSNVTEPETHFLNLRPQTRLLRLVDYSRAQRPHSSSLCFVMLSWVVSVVFSVLECARF